MPTQTKSENGVAGFLFTPVWAWIDYPALELVGDDLPDDPAYHGFKIEVITNINGFKAREHDVALREFVAASTVFAESGDMEALNEAEERYLAAIAWRVRAWNWREPNVDGDIVDLPAPGNTVEENGWRAFFYLPPDLRTWVVRVIRQAVRPKVMTLPSPHVGTTVGPTPPPISPEATPPDS
jgi:hypothetical protein